MSTPLRLRFVAYSMLWMSGTVLSFAALSISSLDLLYIVSLAGFLSLVEVTAPTETSVPWRSRVSRIAVAGIIGFVIIAVRAMITLLPDRYIPLVIGF